MRIERTGVVSPLLPRFETFVRDVLGGESLDDGQSEEEKRPDWICRDIAIAIEIKTLIGDGSERLKNLVDGFERREDWPRLFGRASLEAFFEHTSDPDLLRAQTIERIGRPIKNHIKTADDQLGAFSRRTDDKSLVRLLVLLNEDHLIYPPDIVQLAIAKAMMAADGVNVRRSNIDAVMYLTERHAVMNGAQLQLPILIIDGVGCRDNPEKRQRVVRFAQGWVDWMGYENASRDVPSSAFGAIEAVPDRMSKPDFWRLQYRRSPYLRGVEQEVLRDVYDDVMLQLLLHSIPTSPLLLQNRDSNRWLERYFHFQEEFCQRGVSQDEMQLESGRLKLACKRQKLGDVIYEWIPSIFAESQ